MTASIGFFDDVLLARAEAVVRLYQGLGLKLVTAESCTGGLLPALLTEIPGSSIVLDRGFVTYSNQAKEETIGVPNALIAAHGAVSEPVARAMADGALRASRGHIALATTGIAGPGGGSDEKPVGLVFLASASRGGETMVQERRFGDLGRTQIRRATLIAALDMIEARAR